MKKILLLSATPLEHGTHQILGTHIDITGVGKINAAMNTTRLINNVNPTIVVNFGSCGGTHEHKIGELLRIKHCYNDIDCRPFAGYGYTPFKNNLGLIEIDTPDGNTSCFTSDTFYSSDRNDYSDMYMSTRKQVDVVDMELYSIAQVCKEYGIPLYSYKWVSDTGDSNQWKEYADSGFKNFVTEFSKILEKQYE